MDKEELALCREVYEQTKWESNQPISVNTDTDLDGHYYIYSSDFLLEKLPQFLTFDEYDCRLEVSPAGYGRKYSRGYQPKTPYVSVWCAVYSDNKGTPVKLASANTPLKALLFLTIELSKQGLLT